VKLTRSIGTLMLTEIGKKLLNGDINLTKISFPIKCSVAKSALERTARSMCFFPLYLTKAA